MADQPQLPRDDSIPGSLAGFMQRFSSEAACAGLLRRWRYPEGFRCPRCCGERSWYIATRKLDECRACGRQVSLTAGTAMHKTRKPLSLWFLAMFLFASSKRGISALELKRQLGVSYQTAWTWLHKLRSAVGERTITQLVGTVELDETYVGGVEEGNGGRSTAKKFPVGAAVEAPRTTRGFGRTRLVALSDASGESLQDLAEVLVSRSAYVISDGWQGYSRLKDLGFRHRAINIKQSGKKAHVVLPGVHRVASLLKRLLIGTYQGAISRRHAQKYLDEYEFRFNRRTSASRGLVFQRLLSCVAGRQSPPYWRIVGRPDPGTPIGLGGAA